MRQPHDVVVEARAVGKLDVHEAEVEPFARVERPFAVDSPARHESRYRASALSRRIARPAASASSAAALPRAPRRALRATTWRPGSRAPACAQRRTRRAASTPAPARAPPAMLCGTRDVRDRQRQVEPHVAVHVCEPAGFADERIAVQQHERRLAESLEQRLEVGGSARQRWRSASPNPQCTCTGSGSPVASFASSAEITSSGNAVEPAAISGDRLQRDEARLAGDPTSPGS